MLQEINKQIDNINKSIEWIKVNKPEDFKQRYLQLVDDRRTLKKNKDSCSKQSRHSSFWQKSGRQILSNKLLIARA